VGSTIAVALRPEMVSLGERLTQDNNVRGTVVDVSFLGSIVRIRVAVTEGVVVTVDEFNEPTLVLPQIGETATVSFPAEGPLVLESIPVVDPDELIAEA
jgi:putative spermidine/putrescine transport system ATP-binding protein